MKVTPVASPHAMSTPQTSNSGDARARAISRLTQSPVLNQNAVSPEEIGAIQTQPPKKRDAGEGEVAANASESSQEEINDESELQAAPSSESNEASTAAEEPPAPAKDPALSRQFAQLARQEKALRAKAQAQEQAIKAREAALAAREAELASKAPDLSKYISRDRLKSEALAVLAEEGVSYDELANQLLNQQAVPPQVVAQMRQLEAKIAAMEKANEESQKNYSNSQQQAYDAAVKQIKTDAKRLVFTDANFETVKATNSVDDVVELITQTYEKDGVLLSVEEAAQQVEDYLVEEATKIAQISKIQKRLQSNASKQSATLQAQKQSQNAQPKAQPQPMKTLTNAASSQRKLSAKERAILAFKGELKG